MEVGRQGGEGGRRGREEESYKQMKASIGCNESLLSDKE